MEGKFFVFDLQRFSAESIQTSKSLVVAESIGGDGTATYYDSIQEAIEAADNKNMTITLLKNVTDAEGFTIGDSNTDSLTKVLFNLDGYKLSFETTTLNGTANNNTTTAISIGADAAVSIVSGLGGIYASGSTNADYGTIDISNIAQNTFGRLIDNNGSSLVINSVTLDGKNLNGQSTGTDGAVLWQNSGTLDLNGDTNILAQSGNYNAIKGDTANEFTINANLNNEEATINGIAFTGSTATNGHISISGGVIDNIAFTSAASTGAGQISISGGIINSMYDSTTSLLAYNSSSVAGSDFYIGKEGWNRDPYEGATKFNYAASTGSGIGDFILSATSTVTMASTEFGYDTANSVLGIPTLATASWEKNGAASSYGLAYMTYSRDKDAVTLTAATSAPTGDNKHIDIVEKENSDAAEGAGVLEASVKLIDASAVSVATSIVGNSLDNTIYGGTGADSLTGNGGTNVFYFSKGADVITDYQINVDKVIKSDSNFVPHGDSISVVNTNDLCIAFDSGDSITFSGMGASLNNTNNPVPTRGVKLEAGGKTYIYTTYSVADMTGDRPNGITLASGYSSGSPNTFNATTAFGTINAAVVGTPVSITGTDSANYIVASDAGSSLNGNGGNDTLVGGAGADVFVYKSGKNVIQNYNSTGDSLSVDVSKITGVKTSGNDLIFSAGTGNQITFKPVVSGTSSTNVEKVSLTSGEIISADGILSDANKKLTLFASAKGRITLPNGVEEIDASKIKSNVVILEGSSSLSGTTTYTFATENRKKDVFEYNGGAVSINGYEAGYDRLNLGNYSDIAAFSVSSGNVQISVSGYSGENNIISLTGAADKEVLLHDSNKSGYRKVVFHDNSIIFDKATNPTSATLLPNAESYNATQNPTVKNIVLDYRVAGAISITAGDSNNTTVDAGAASATGISLIGGAKNDKLIGNGNEDMFVYTAGRDAVENFSVGSDLISLSGANVQLEDISKITANKKGFKLTFDSRNILDVKTSGSSFKTLESTVSINGGEYIFGKNAVGSLAGSDIHVSLTSGASGTFQTKKYNNATYVDGSRVTKNLTLAGRVNVDEILIGSDNEKSKTTFKGGGGADSLVGGAGTDTFFYAKGNGGETTIANFDFSKDKLKIATGTIMKIETVSDGLKFAMNNGKKGNTTEVGSFTIKSFSDNGTQADIGTDKAKNILIKANNTLYWFEGGELVTGTKDAAMNTVLRDYKKSSSDYAVVDLGYSTNLVKAGIATTTETAFSADDHKKSNLTTT